MLLSLVRSMMPAHLAIGLLEVSLTKKETLPNLIKSPTPNYESFTMINFDHSSMKRMGINLPATNSLLELSSFSPLHIVHANLCDLAIMSKLSTHFESFREAPCTREIG